MIAAPIRLAALVASIASFAGVASAQLTVFTDQAAWESAVRGIGLTSNVETFDGLSVFNLQPSSGLVRVNSDFGIEVTGINSPEADDAFIDAGRFHGEIFPLTEHASYDHVFNRPVRAFGQFFDGAASGLGIKISTPDGDIAVKDFYSGFEDGFLGFVSDNAYDRVSIIGGDIDVFGSTSGEIYEALDLSYSRAGVLPGRSLRFQLLVNRNGQDVLFSETVDKVVDDQVEFDNLSGLQFFEPDGPSALSPVNVGFDITANDSIAFDFSKTSGGRFGDADFNGYVFSDAADNLPPIIGVSIGSSTTFGLTPEDITFTEDEIRIDVSGLSFSRSTTAILHLEFGSELTLPGDYNSDGVVDASDYTVWRDNVGAQPGALPNDPDGGSIGDAQYQTWKANYGASLTQSLTLTATAIPEPTSLTLLGFWAAFATLARRNRISLGDANPA